MKPIRIAKFLFLVSLINVNLVSNATEPGDKDSEDITRVKLTKHISRIEINLADRAVVIERNQTLTDTIPPPFDKTSRPCPPYCIQPIIAAPGVQTLGELELITYLQKSAQTNDILIIDTRLQDWYKRQTIPLAINLPHELFKSKMTHLLESHFNAKRIGEQWDFANAKTLVLFCNGYWNPDSYQVIQQLISLGYPADKIKWYRGGMQAWLSLGLTTEKPEQ